MSSLITSEEIRFVEPHLWRRVLRGALITGDIVAFALGGLAATLIRWGILDARAVVGHSATQVPYVLIAAAMIPIWIALFWSARLYDLDRVMWYGSDEFGRAGRVISVGIIALISIAYALKLPGISRGWVLALWAMSVLLVWAERLVLWMLVRLARRRGRLLRPALVLGGGKAVDHIVERLMSDVTSGVVPVGHLTPNGEAAGDEAQSVPRMGSLEDLEETIKKHWIDSVVVSTGSVGEGTVAGLVAGLRLQPVDTYLSAGLSDVLTRRVLVREVGGIPLVLVRGIRITGYRAVLKRAFDLVVAFMISVLLSPLWVVIASSIKLDDGGPIFFKQARTGRHGVAFEVFKFRTMTLDAEDEHAEMLEHNEADGPIFKMQKDPRVTRVGRALRKLSIDEFPQLINVFRGEMSLVGPRPLPTYETTDLTAQQERRHEVLPGITGMWQVSGRSDLSFDEMVRLDLLYIENWSLMLDMEVMVRTVPAVLATRGAY